MSEYNRDSKLYLQHAVNMFGNYVDGIQQGKYILRIKNFVEDIFNIEKCPMMNTIHVIDENGKVVGHSMIFNQDRATFDRIKKALYQI